MHSDCLTPRAKLVKFEEAKEQDSFLNRRKRLLNKGRKRAIMLNGLKRLFFLTGLFYLFMIAKQLKVNFFGTISRMSGMIMNIKLPKFLLVPLLKIFWSVYKINREEMEIANLKDFPTFRHFFTRKLKISVRTIEDENDEDSICSPWDGTVYNFGEWEGDTFVVVKGTPYKIEEFLFGTGGDVTKKFGNLQEEVYSRGNVLKFCLFYLSPADYHRFHSPAICSVSSRRHIAGKLYPVKPSYVATHPNVFKENERVALFGKWKNGFFSTTFIGATNVGSIVLNFDNEMITNSPLFQGNLVSDKSFNLLESRSDIKDGANWVPPIFTKLRNPKIPRVQSFIGFNHESGEDSTKEDSLLEEQKSGDIDDVTSPQERECLPKIFSKDQSEEYSVSNKGILLKKGQEIGYFNIGSSIMLIFEAPSDSTFDIEVGQKVKLGNTIMKL